MMKHDAFHLVAKMILKAAEFTHLSHGLME